MSNTINLTSQRISFVNKISLLQRALSDDETPTPSYLYKEINDISYESIGYCESLLEFLVDRLRHKSSHVKLKVLKVMKHVLEHGSTEFQLGLRHQVSIVKEHTKFSGPPHPLHGNTPYTMIRNLAMELCEHLYNLNPLALKAAIKSGEETQSPPQPKFDGMGPSSRTGGTIQGFGNSPVSAQSKGIAGTILQEIEKLGTRLSETPADRQAAVLARLNLSGSSSNYQPPVVSVEDREDSTPASSKEKEDPVSSPAHMAGRAVSHHLAGKAGGGWNDDSDDENINDSGDDAMRHKNGDKISGDQEVEDSSTCHHLPDELESQNTESQEKKLVENILTGNVSSSSGDQVQFLSNIEVAEFLQTCERLRCSLILDTVCRHLVQEDSQASARSLQLVEGLVYNRHELINLDVLVAKCKSFLVECFVMAGKLATVAAQEDSAASNRDSSDSSCCGKWRAVQTKAAKLILILQQLSSHKDILPSSRIANELSAASIATGHSQQQPQAVATS